MSRTLFFNIVGLQMDLDDVVGAILDFVRLQPKRNYKIIVGTDSSAKNEVSLITAITVWRVGNGGIHFWTKSEVMKFHGLRERIYRETMQSITLAQELRGRLKEKLGDEFFWDDQIHIDVGRVGPTRELIDTVVGMAKGYGFDVQIKPYAFGASVVADRHT